MPPKRNPNNKIIGVANPIRNTPLMKPDSAYDWWLREKVEEVGECNSKASRKKSQHTATSSSNIVSTAEWDLLQDKSRWYQLAALDRQRYDAEMGINKLLANKSVGTTAAKSPPGTSETSSSSSFIGRPAKTKSTVAKKKQKGLQEAVVHFFYDILQMLSRVEIDRCRRVCRSFNERVGAWPRDAVSLPFYNGLFTSLAFDMHNRDEVDEDYGIDENGRVIRGPEWVGGEYDWQVAQPSCCRGGELELLSKRLVDCAIFPSHCIAKTIVKIELYSPGQSDDDGSDGGSSRKNEKTLHFSVYNLLSEETAFAYLHLLSHLDEIVFIRILFLGCVRLHAEPFRLLSTIRATHQGSTPRQQQRPSYRLLAQDVYTREIWEVEDKWLAHHSGLINWEFLDGTLYSSHEWWRGYGKGEEKNRLSRLLIKLCEWRPYTENISLNLSSKAVFDADNIDQIVEHFTSKAKSLRAAVPYLFIDIEREVTHWPGTCLKSKGKLEMAADAGGREKWKFNFSNKHSGEKLWVKLWHPIGNELHIEKMELSIQVEENVG